MNDSSKSTKCSKCTKILNVLKELEATYRELLKDKEVLIKFVQFIFPEEFHSELSLDASMGSLDFTILQEVYKTYRDMDAKLTKGLEMDLIQCKERLKKSEEENKKLEDQVRLLKLKIAELRDKQENIEKKQRIDASEKGLMDANILLAKMKRTNLGSKLPVERNEEFQKRLNEKNEMILKLKAELNNAHSLMQKYNALISKPKESRESQTEETERDCQEIQTEEGSIDQVNKYKPLKESFIVILLIMVVR